MKTRKSKVVVMDCARPIGLKRGSTYKVVKTVNRLDPHIDEYLTETDLQHLMDTEPDCTVEVIPSKR